MDFTSQRLLRERFPLFINTIKHHSQHIKNICEVKFNTHQTNTTISFQVSKNKPRKKDIVSRPISQYKN